MVVGTPGTPGLYFRIVRIKNCSREELFPSALRRSRPSRQLGIVGSSLERPWETALQQFPNWHHSEIVKGRKRTGRFRPQSELSGSPSDDVPLWAAVPNDVAVEG